MSYQQSRADFEYLETIISIDDTVDQMSRLTEFMENPTKAYANDLYESLIYQWFIEQGSKHISRIFRVEFNPDKKTKRIAESYGISLDFIE